MKKRKKFLKFIFTTFFILLCFFVIGSTAYYNIVTNGVTLDTSKFESTNNSPLCVFDKNLEQIKPNSASYIKLTKLSTNTKDAFICAEDKRFYKHGGLDYIRIGGALISNLKTKSFSQGASTISQQLVKNSQLSNKKTIDRKLKEFRLTKQLEKKYTKNQILEFYLNNIYFGNGCYGIENASWHYFGKSASSLTLAESALLAGTINAPSLYDIENKTEKALERKNLILDLMLKYKKINEKELLAAKNEEIKFNITDISGCSSYFKNIIEEASKILDINETKIKNNNYKIYTSIDKNLNSKIKNIVADYKIDGDVINIVLDNKSHSIVAINGKNKILESKWQPGSTIKPILVYAPAIEKNIITSSTKLLDEKINIAGYSPENSDKKYHGYISAKQALSKSYNIPAVKLLNEIGVDEAKEIANKFGIEFDESDNHLALSLGGFKNGVEPIKLCEAYSVFALNGKYEKSSYIEKITLNGKTVYTKKSNKKQIIKENTAKEINEMLIECAQNGTAKRLSDLSFDVASKTGTVGKENSNKNRIAYNIAYTPETTILTLIYGESLNESINGATYPTMINKSILNQINKKQKQSKLSINSNKNVNEQKETKNKTLDYTLTAINSPNSKPILCFTLNNSYDFKLVRTHKKEEEIIFSTSQKTQNNIKYIDKSAKTNEIYEYKVIYLSKNKNEEFTSNIIKLKSY